MKARLNRREAESLLKAFSSLVKVQGLYPPGHVTVQAAEEGLERLLRTLFSVPEPIVVGAADGYMIAGEVAFFEESSHARELNQRFASRGIEGAQLNPGVRAAEMARFCEWLRKPAAANWSGTHITLTSKEKGEWERGLELRGAALDALDDAAREVREGRVPNPAKAKECVHAFGELLEESPTIAHGLVLIKDYDQYTFHHSVNVCMLTLALGQSLDVTKDELEAVGVGGLFHDIGKTRTPVEVIRKPGKLTQEEFALIRWHPVHSREILAQMPTIDAPVPQIVFEHHMRFDGGGYPNRSDGALHPLSPIITAADMFDAMTSHRSYSLPWPLPEAIKVIERASGLQLPPHVSDAFVRLMGRVPVGTFVRLSTGEVGVVSQLEGGEPAKVQLISAPDGKEYPNGEWPTRTVASGEVVAWVDHLVHRVDAVRVLRGAAAR
jgi:putative nucleotidyltransferase with HDIG domain